MTESPICSVEQALEDFKEGKFVIVVDDEDRENEGDLITAAELIDYYDISGCYILRPTYAAPPPCRFVVPTRFGSSSRTS